MAGNVAAAVHADRMVPPAEGMDRFAAALARAPVFVFEQDTGLRYRWVPMPIPALGVHDPVTALGRTDGELLGEEAAVALDELKRHVLESGEGERADVEVATPAGRFVLDLSVHPLRDASGAVAGLTCAAVDVTARARVEEDLRRSRRLLAESEHLARIGSWEWDVAGDRITWSDGLYEIYGLTPESFDPRFAARDQRVHPDDRERVAEAVGRALETCGEIDMEYRIVRPDGRVRRVHGRAEVIVGDDGRPARMAGTAQDVTELRAAEEALERTAAELGQRAAELHRVTRRAPGTVRDVEEALSARQLEILSLIADGLGNGEVAARLYLSEATVKWHVRQILRKLRVSNRAEAVAQYVRTHAAEQ
jgi:PAS domain S-box-containing protein